MAEFEEVISKLPKSDYKAYCDKVLLGRWQIYNIFVNWSLSSTLVPRNCA
jgi:hypothetical protein